MKIEHAQREHASSIARKHKVHQRKLGCSAGVTGLGSDQDHVPPAEHGPKISGPCSHMLTGGNVVLEKCLDHTTSSLCGREILGSRSAGGMEWRSEPGPETMGLFHTGCATYFSSVQGYGSFTHVWQGASRPCTKQALHLWNKRHNVRRSGGDAAPSDDSFCSATRGEFSVKLAT